MKALAEKVMPGTVEAKIADILATMRAEQFACQVEMPSSILRIDRTLYRIFGNLGACLLGGSA